MCAGDVMRMGEENRRRKNVLWDMFRLRDLQNQVRFEKTSNTPPIFVEVRARRTAVLDGDQFEGDARMRMGEGGPRCNGAPPKLRWRRRPEDGAVIRSKRHDDKFGESLGYLMQR